MVRSSLRFKEHAVNGSGWFLTINWSNGDRTDAGTCTDTETETETCAGAGAATYELRKGIIDWDSISLSDVLQKSSGISSSCGYVGDCGTESSFKDKAIAFFTLFSSSSSSLLRFPATFVDCLKAIAMLSDKSHLQKKQFGVSCPLW